MAVLEKLNNICESCVDSLGYEFVGLENIGTNSRNLLRVYAQSSSGISIDELQYIAKRLKAQIAAEFPEEANYAIEVSSPGLDRKLFNTKQCRQFIGSEVKIRLKRPIDNFKKLQGLLVSVSEDGKNIIIEPNSYDGSLNLLFEDIEQVRLVPKFKY